MVGLVHGPDRTVALPAEDWRTATVDLVIPALNEERNIALCLASVVKQTFRPRRIILIDDGSTDRTIAFARAFCEVNDIPVTLIRRERPIGKTPTIKRQAREFDSDVEFILDGDTVLESEHYIERTVQELYKAVGIASACGTILPLREVDRRQVAGTAPYQRFATLVPMARESFRLGRPAQLKRAVTNVYRDVLYMFLQGFVYHGQMVFFGSISHPVGCAVAYRRKYISELFDRYEPVFGDDLTNSEDIFIGLALVNEGYRNIQLSDVRARSEEPEATRLPRQVYLWSSAFLQSCYYFDTLLRSPFKSIRRYRHRKVTEKKFAAVIREQRKAQEPYRQRFGEEYTKRYGRPIGWVLLLSAVEKILFPTTLFVMVILGLWQALLTTVVIESLLSTCILTVVARGRRPEYFLKGLAVTPLRYMMLFYDLVTIFRFAADIWFRRKRDWRK